MTRKRTASQFHDDGHLENDEDDGYLESDDFIAAEIGDLMVAITADFPDKKQKRSRWKVWSASGYTFGEKNICWKPARVATMVWWIRIWSAEALALVQLLPRPHDIFCHNLNSRCWDELTSSWTILTTQRTTERCSRSNRYPSMYLSLGWIRILRVDDEASSSWDTPNLQQKSGEFCGSGQLEGDRQTRRLPRNASKCDMSWIRSRTSQ